MFEKFAGSKLLSWRSPIWPITGLTLLEKQPDHRRHYLQHQGPISGNRGVVTQVARGTCTVAIGEYSIELTLDGGSTITITQDGEKWTAISDM